MERTRHKRVDRTPERVTRKQDPRPVFRAGIFCFLLSGRAYFFGRHEVTVNPVRHPPTSRCPGRAPRRRPPADRPRPARFPAVTDSNRERERERASRLRVWSTNAPFAFAFAITRRDRDAGPPSPARRGRDASPFRKHRPRKWRELKLGLPAYRFGKHLRWRERDISAWNDSGGARRKRSYAARLRETIRAGKHARGCVRKLCAEKYVNPLPRQCRLTYIEVVSFPAHGVEAPYAG
jgi:hypothetical protein